MCVRVRGRPGFGWDKRQEPVVRSIWRVGWKQACVRVGFWGLKSISYMYNSCVLNKGNYLYFRIHSICFQFLNMQNCILAGFGRDQSWHSSNNMMSNVTVANVEYKAYGIVDICAKQAERLWKEYLSINSKNCNYARFYMVQSWHSTNRLIWHQMWNIWRIVWPTFLQNKRRYLDSNM